MSKLVIVESPTKAKTISRMLGKDYDIIASMGHIRDLPERSLGVDIDKDFAPQYVETPKGKSIVQKLKRSAKKAEAIYLAPDPDREGESIAWHLKEVLQGVAKVPFQRVTFHEITRNAIDNAMANPTDININLVDAQQARRVLDRIVGYKTSPLLWRSIAKGSSAGRVQSAALRLIVERERAIQDFVPEEYWTFGVTLNSAGGDFKAKLFKINQADFKVPNATDANLIKDAVENGKAPIVEKVTTQERKRNPYPPFTTSTLQQTANTVLRYTSNNVMKYAQELYEGIELGSGGPVGLITYMRTDSVTIAKEAQYACSKFIKENYGEEYAPAKFNYYKNKAAAQEAHEAIRPTDVNRTPESVAPYLDPKQLKVYTLIWRRFVASQMAAAKYSQTTVDTNVVGSDDKNYSFRAVANVPLFAGFTRVFDESDKTDVEADRQAKVLGTQKEGDTLVLKDFESTQKFTEPPPRFSEAALIKALEENGIGRPSTYASIIKTILDRDYVGRDQGRLIPTELGYTVNDFLVGRLPELFDIGFTAQMEDELDEIEAGSLLYVDMLKKFYEKFEPWIKGALELDSIGGNLVAPILELFNGVAYEPSNKVGSRTFDDKKFVTSVAKKFSNDGMVSQKQFNALLQMVVRYWEKLPAEKIDILDAEIKSQLDELKVIRDEKAKEYEKIKEEAPPPNPELLKLLDCFSEVKFAEPEKKSKFAFDDKKFFTSLQRQVEFGKVLSEKQLNALAKLGSRYKDSLKDIEFVEKVLGTLPEVKVPSESDNGTGAQGEEEVVLPSANPPEVQAKLAALSKVDKWKKGKKKGRFVQDDKAFYESLKKHDSQGRVLSEKQIAVLDKFIEKYGVEL